MLEFAVEGGYLFPYIRPRREGVRTAKGAYRSTRFEEAFETAEEATFTGAERSVLNAEVTLTAEVE